VNKFGVLVVVLIEVRKLKVFVDPPTRARQNSLVSSIYSKNYATRFDLLTSINEVPDSSF
jgi:hypothetical protein